ncbi:unnamed protein product [Parascedosporium putredinis]|uniref:Uncharacterized protein n=1 Tax=Parascedosporium putredinis TaxID=1442378 RepID=A0A9P1GY01_9PEZI|nr:unnamed protein product [Parascedosporium putredinis]CAI7991169.1 unnamed protein product [Parascedosporium putredinis]
MSNYATHALPKISSAGLTPDNVALELKSASILRSQVDKLADCVSETLIGTARERISGYEAWIKGSRGPGRGRATQTVLDIIDEIDFRKRYLGNQLTLYQLQKQQETEKPRAPGSHTAKLQAYNEIKDIAQELMGLVADNRNVTIKTLYESNEFGVSAAD